MWSSSLIVEAGSLNALFSIPFSQCSRRLVSRQTRTPRPLNRSSSVAGLFGFSPAIPRSTLKLMSEKYPKHQRQVSVPALEMGVSGSPWIFPARFLCNDLNCSYFLLVAYSRKRCDSDFLKKNLRPFTVQSVFISFLS